MRIYQRTGSKIWWMTYSIGGKRFRDSTGTRSKRQAQKVAAKREAEIFEGSYFPNKKRSHLSVEGLRDLWLDHAKHKRSIDSDRRRFVTIIEHFGGSTPIATITTGDVERFRDELCETVTRRGKPMAPATVNRYLALLRSSLRFAARDYRHQDPMGRVTLLPERNKRERLCSPEEYEALLEAARSKVRLAIVLGYEQGLRRGEVCSLRWEDVSLRKPAKLHVRADRSKNAEPRTLPLTARTVQELRAAARQIDGLVVGLTPDALSAAFIKLCQQLDIRGLRLHDLRGAAITRVARAGASLAELQQFSGHKSIQALMRYLKTDEDRLRKIMESIDAG